jgi:hypothetical protein
MRSARSRAPPSCPQEFTRELHTSEPDEPLASVGMRRQLPQSKPLLQAANAARSFALAQTRFESLRLPHLLGQPLERGGLRAGHGLPPPQPRVPTRWLGSLLLLDLAFRSLLPWHHASSSTFLRVIVILQILSNHRKRGNDLAAFASELSKNVSGANHCFSLRLHGGFRATRAIDLFDVFPGVIADPPHIMATTILKVLR